LVVEDESSTTTVTQAVVAMNRVAAANARM
jgi:hypothetical protein